MLWPKIHTRNLITKKNSYGSKIPLLPHNFSNGPSLKNRKVKIKLKGIQKSSKYIDTSKGDSARPPIQVFSAPNST